MCWLKKPEATTKWNPFLVLAGAPEVSRDPPACQSEGTRHAKWRSANIHFHNHCWLRHWPGSHAETSEQTGISANKQANQFYENQQTNSQEVSGRGQTLKDYDIQVFWLEQMKIRRCCCWKKSRPQKIVRKMTGNVAKLFRYVFNCSDNMVKISISRKVWGG